MNEWKLLISGGMIGLLLCSLFVIIVLYRLSPMLQSRRERSLRDQHREPVPRFGGIALFFGFIGTLIIVWLLPFEKRGLGFQLLSENRFAGLCIGGFLAWALGFCDDIIQLRARWKLTGQIGIAFLAIGFGFEINLVLIPFLQTVNLGLWSWPLTVLWIVGVMNAVNLIDGLDGLASGLSIIALSFMAVICWWMSQLNLLLLIIILIGVTLGFWSFNRPPATIFMGDSGSLFLGYSVAVLSIWIPGTQAGTQSILPILILAVPILDTIFAPPPDFQRVYSSSRNGLFNFECNALWWSCAFGFQFELPAGICLFSSNYTGVSFALLAGIRCNPQTTELILGTR